MKKLLEDENIDAETLNKKVEEVSKTAMQLGQAMYQANGSENPAEAAAAASAAPESENNSDEKVVDADFEKVDENDDKNSNASTGS